jgi:integrase
LLREFMLDQLARNGRSDSDLIFGRTARRPFDPSTIQNRADKAREAPNARERRAADEEGREAALLERITPHPCRYTFASLMIAAGVNAKALQTFLGHASITETYDRYGHLMPGSEAEAAELLDGYLGAQVKRGEEQGRTVNAIRSRPKLHVPDLAGE